ncbi:MAG: hypothetical protein CMO55_09450 [Verrucomicrobiales bacterium]|nr:hypothetical protein [Verrucomicrobiales bacterium]
MTAETPTFNRARHWLVLVPAMTIPFVAAFFYFVLFPGTAFGNSFYTGVKFFLLIWPMVSILFILRRARVERFSVVRHRASLWPGIAFGVFVVGLMMFLIKITPLGTVVDDNGARMAERIEGLGVVEHYLWFSIFISFIHAALEEYYWRWFVFGRLRVVVPVNVAHVIAAVGFASHHIVILSQFFPIGWAIFLGACVGIGGAFWSWTYQKYGSLWGAWVSHMLVDLGIMWVGWEVLQAQ